MIFIKNKQAPIKSICFVIRMMEYLELNKNRNSEFKKVKLGCQKLEFLYRFATCFICWAENVTVPCLKLYNNYSRSTRNRINHKHLKDASNVITKWG